MDGITEINDAGWKPAIRSEDAVRKDQAPIACDDIVE
jgi:hypothetical protein